MQHDITLELLKSEKFQRWYPGIDDPPKPPSREESSNALKAVLERHYSPDELAAAWGVSAETVRVLFRDEPGVLKIGQPTTRFKRGYILIRIPESVAERVHTRLSC